MIAPTPCVAALVTISIWPGDAVLGRRSEELEGRRVLQLLLRLESALMGLVEGHDAEELRHEHHLRLLRGNKWRRNDCRRTKRGELQPALFGEPHVEIVGIRVVFLEEQIQSFACTDVRRSLVVSRDGIGDLCRPVGHNWCGV